jgi:hypothetical protein
MRIRTARSGLAAIALSRASFVVSEFGGSDASAAIRTTNSKHCKQYSADIKKTNYTPQEQMNSYGKIAKRRTRRTESGIPKLAGELQDALNRGGTKSQESSPKAFFSKIQSQLRTNCEE